MQPEQEANPSPKDLEPSKSRAVVRAALALAIVTAVAAYIYGVLFGRIPQGQKLGAVDLGIICVAAVVVSALAYPNLLDRIGRIKLGSLELELKKLHSAQQAQENELDDLRFVLTMLLQPSELQHLRDIQMGRTQNHIGSHSLRTELRKLRTMQLIQNCNGKKMADIKDQAKADLKDFVELTDRGRKYLNRLGDDRDQTTG